MKRFLKGVGCSFIAGAMITIGSGAGFAKSLTVGVSWSNFQDVRWKTD